MSKAMVKAASVLLSLILLLASLAATPIAAASPTITVTAEVNPATGEVIVSGTISSGAGSAVTVQVMNPSGGIDYMDQGISGEGGRFQFSYPLDRNAEGVYRVRAGGAGVEQPANTQFTYRSGRDSGGGAGHIITVPDRRGKIELRDNGTILGQPYYDESSKEALLALDPQILQSAAEAAETNESGTKFIPITVGEMEGAQFYVMEWPVAALSEAGANLVYKLETAVGIVELPGNMLHEALGSSDTIELVIAHADNTVLDETLQAAVGERPVIRIYFRVNGIEVPWSNTQSPVTIAIPYRPAMEERSQTEHIVVWHIDNAGKVQPVPNGHYNGATGNVVFETKHFSYFAIAYVLRTFDDIAHMPWAKKPIEVLASKGIINGISNSEFSPGRPVTRADYTLLLVRTLELAAHAASVERFADVRPGSYYEQELTIARALGIAQGYGDNSFRPDETISRQDMMVLTARALEQYGRLLPADSTDILDRFRDRDAISDYAAAYIASLVNNGLIEGAGSGRLNPRGLTTRAEAAVFLYRIYMRQQTE